MATQKNTQKTNTKTQETKAKRTQTGKTNTTKKEETTMKTNTAIETTQTTTTNIQKEENMMNTNQASNPTVLTKELMTKVTGLMTEQGKTLEEALLMVLSQAESEGKIRKATNPTGPRKDNIAYIQGLNDLPELRRVKKIAYAKKSKSKNNPAACERYDQEIAEASKRINQLLALIPNDETGWLKAKELGEDAATQFNYFLVPFEENLNERVDAVAKKKGLTKAQVKAALIAAKAEVPAAVPEELKAAMAERMAHNDQRVLTVAKKAAYVLVEG